MLLEQFSKSQTSVEWTHQDQAAGGGDARALESELERGAEGELKG
jgi:hypothetical protein